MDSDELIAKYNQSAETYAKSRVGTEDTDALEKIRNYLAIGSKVLDVGCAAGRDTRILKDMGYDVVGVDMADKLLDIARKSNPEISFVVADMRKLPFKDASFDAVWASAVLHHVRKAEMFGVLQEFSRILTAGGLVYIHTKTGQGLLRTSEASVGGATREFERITPEELDTMLRQTGYRKLSIEVKASKSRPDVYWANAYYKKQS